MLKSEKTNRIEGFTALRVFFMLMIFIHHCDFSYSGGGYCAVVGFFILSGFCMTLGYGQKVLQPDFSWKNFMVHRAIKLYPVHWISLLLMWLLTGCYFHFGPKFMGTFATNALLLQSWIPYKWAYFSYNSPSWYLCDILFFAAVFPFIMNGLNRLPIKGNLLVLTLVILAILTLSVCMPHELRHAWLYIHPISRLADCMIGVFLAKGYLLFVENQSIRSQIERNVRLFDAIIFVSFALVLIQSIYRIGYDAIYNVASWLPISVLITAMAFRAMSVQKTLVSKLLNSNVIQYTGVCSLSFYILHIPVMETLRLLNNDWGPNSKSIIGGSVALIVTILLSRLSYHIIERRLTNYLNNKLIKI